MSRSVIAVLGNLCSSTACRTLCSISSVVRGETIVRGLATKISARTRDPVQMAQNLADSKTTVKVELPDRLKGLDKNVWVEYTGLAAEHKAVNLGQGFPDFPPPDYVTKALAEATDGANHMLNQYTRGYGHLRLVKILAEVFGKIHNRPIDPLTEVLVTVGAYQSLFCSIMGLINPGDEVIIIEPYFDCYEPMVKYAGGVPVFVPLRPSKRGEIMQSAEWTLDMKELESKFSNKTKLIILNTPNNPLGKVFTKQELQNIADLCIRKNIFVISDEVYEWLVFQPSQHVRIADLPGMWERTITIRSAGKTFSVTGWKLGWSIGPANLIRNCQVMYQTVSYTMATPLQEAVAVGFEIENKRLGTPHCYFLELPAMLEGKRDRMAEMLIAAGFIPTIPEGGYFMLADYSKLKNSPKLQGGDEAKDSQFVKWLTVEKKLATIPVSAFYSQEHKHLAEDYIRFCFCKNDDTLGKTEKILTDWMKETAQ